jgi:hypothetical protein
MTGIDIAKLDGGLATSSGSWWAHERSCVISKVEQGVLVWELLLLLDQAATVGWWAHERSCLIRKVELENKVEQGVLFWELLLRDQAATVGWWAHERSCLISKVELDSKVELGVLFRAGALAFSKVELDNKVEQGVLFRELLLLDQAATVGWWAHERSCLISKVELDSKVEQGVLFRELLLSARSNLITRSNKGCSFGSSCYLIKRLWWAGGLPKGAA